MNYYDEITEVNQLGDFIDLCISNKEVILDVESSGTDPFTSILYLVQIMIGGKVFVFNMLKFPAINYVLSLIEDKLVIGHNIKFDIKMLAQKTGILLKNVYCTMYAETIRHNGKTGANRMISLENLYKFYFNEIINKEVRTEFYKSEQPLTSFTQQQLAYSAMDVIYTSRIYEAQSKWLNSIRRVMDLEMKVLPVVAAMELNGMPFNTKKWAALLEVVEPEADNYELLARHEAYDIINTKKPINAFEAASLIKIPLKTKTIQEYARSLIDDESKRKFIIDHINLGSYIQVGNLISIAGFKTRSTNKKDIEHIRNECKFVDFLLTYREKTKLVSTYGQEFMDKVNKDTGRLHCEFGQLSTDTGRFSSSNPNLQNIPAVETYRECFEVEDEDYMVITADYSQEELRLTAALTRDPAMLDSFLNDIDLHTKSASLIFDTDLESVTKEQRAIAKGYNFALSYGSTEYGLARNFGFTVKVAKEYLDKYMEAHSTLFLVKDAISDKALELGYTSTLIGRKRYLEVPTFFSGPDGYKNRNYLLSTIRRKAFNTVIQGTGADIIKIALCNLFYNNPFGDKLTIVSTVHDEIVCVVHKSIISEAEEFIRAEMIKAEKPFIAEIPAIVTVKTKKHWTK